MGGIFLYFFFDAFILSGDKTKNHYFLEQFFLSQYLWEPPAAAAGAAVFINNVSAIVIVQPNRGSSETSKLTGAQIDRGFKL